MSVSWAGGGHCVLHISLYPASWHHITPRQLLITHYWASAHTRAAQLTLCQYWSQLTSEPQHPLRHNIHNGLKIFTIPRMMSCDHKKPHFLAPATILPDSTWTRGLASCLDQLQPIETRKSRQSTSKNLSWFLLVFRLGTGLCSLSLCFFLEKYGSLMIFSYRAETGILFLERAKAERGSFRIY